MVLGSALHTLSEPAADLDLIVERRAGSIEIYIGGDADQLVAFSGAQASRFLNADGYIPFERFFAGTWTLGEHLLAHYDVRVDGQSAQAHAMSLMVHPDTFPVAFRDSVDAVTAVSICSVANPPGDLTLADASLYSGYIVYTEDENATLTLHHTATLAALGATRLTVRVHDFKNGVLHASSLLTWEVGGALHLDGDSLASLMLDAPSPLERLQRNAS